MKATVISNCDLTFHDIKKVSFKVDKPFSCRKAGDQLECLEIRFENSSGDSGTLSLSFEPGIKIELGNLKSLQKLKNIIFDVCGVQING